MNQRIFELQLEEAHKNDISFEKRPVEDARLFQARPRHHLPLKLKRYENESKDVEVKKSGIPCAIL